MKYIKLFSKITPIQMFILLSIAALVIFTVKFFRINKQWRRIRVEIVGKNWSSTYSPYGYKTPLWMSGKLAVGQMERDAGGNIIAKIQRIDDYERGPEEAEVYITTDVLANYNPRMENYIYKGRGIELGQPIELRFGDTLVVGQIIDTEVPKNGYPMKEILIKGLLKNQFIWKANILTAGEKMQNRGTNETIAEIQSVTLEPPSGQTITNLLNGETILVENIQNLTNIVVTLKLRVEKYNHYYYFAGHQQIKVGNFLYLYTQNINLIPIEIQSVTDLY